MKLKCAVHHCTNVYTNQPKRTDLSFFRVPKGERGALWMEKIGRPNLTEITLNARICSLHFEDRFFKTTKKNRLIPAAYPTLLLEPPVHVEEEKEEESPRAVSPEPKKIKIIPRKRSALCQTPKVLSKITPCKQKVLRQIKTKQKKKKKPRPVPPKKSSVTVQDFLNYCRAHLNTSICNLIKMQLQLSKRHPHDCMYTSEFKQFAFTVYFLGPNVYRILSRTFNLPSQRKLRRMISNWCINSGIDNFIFTVIRSKVAVMSSLARDCVLCAGEMSIKSSLFYNISDDYIVGLHSINGTREFRPVSSALVLMARGVNVNWKQPVAYFLVNKCCPTNEMHRIICTVIEKLIETGLNVLGFISNQGSSFIKLAKALGVTVEKHFFNVAGRKIFYIYDTPHLLISTRNQFFTKSFISDSGQTSKTHVEQFFAKDKERPFKLAPKLTDSHLNPNGFERMKVKYAAQILSATVAAALNTYVFFNALPVTSLSTAAFIFKIDELFDVLNSCSFKSAKEINQPLTGRGRQLKILQEMLKFFQTVQVFHYNQNVTDQMQFIKGWQITIKSVLCLWDILKSRTKLLCTRRLNQDCLEHFFESVRKQGGRNHNPTPVQFSRAFKQLFCANYFKCVKGSNCIEDLDAILLSPETVQDVFKHVVIDDRRISSSEFFGIANPDYHNLNIRKENAIEDVSSYLIRKCLENHTCNTCINSLMFSQCSTPRVKVFEDEVEYTFEEVIVPKDDFITYIKRLDEEFCSKFPEFSVQTNVGELLKQSLISINCSFNCCPDFDKNYLVSYFIRVRLFFTVKFINNSFKKQKSINKKCNILINVESL